MVHPSWNRYITTGAGLRVWYILWHLSSWDTYFITTGAWTWTRRNMTKSQGTESQITWYSKWSDQIPCISIFTFPRSKLGNLLFIFISESSIPREFRSHFARYQFFPPSFAQFWVLRPYMFIYIASFLLFKINESLAAFRTCFKFVWWRRRRAGG